MADERKRFLIDTIYNSQGLKEYTNDLTTARGVSNQFGVTLSRNAKIVDSQVSNSFSKTGKQIQRTTSIIEDSGRRVKVTWDRLGNQTKLVGTSVSKASTGFRKAGAELGKLATRAGLVIPTWLLLRGAITGVINTVRDAIKFLADWEFQLAQIRIVSTDSASSIDNLSKSLLALSKNLGISNEEIGEGAKLYVQQGRAIEEIIPLMNATSKLSLLTGRNIVKSVEDMTAVLKAYNLEASDAITVVDKITNVMLNHAITADDLAQAYKATASTASALGVSLEELTGFVTAIKTETRDTGSKVGLALRTMLSRITTSSAEALQSLTQIPFFLDETGQATNRVSPNLRNLGTILSEISSRFDSLGTAQQSQVAKLIGGVRRQNQAFALFNNFTEAIEAQADALFSLGKADDAIETLTDTLRLRINRLTGAWQTFVDAVGDTGTFKTAISNLQDQIEGLSAIINPRETFRSGLIAELTELQQQSERGTGFAESLEKARARALELRDSLESGRITLQEANAQATIFAERISRTGRSIDFEFDVTDNLNDFIGQLESRRTDIRELAVQSEVESLRLALNQDLVNTASDISKVVENNTSQLGQKILFSISPLIERFVNAQTDIGQLEELLDPTQLQSTLDTLTEFRDALAQSVSPDQINAFDDLVQKLIDTREQIDRVTDRTEQFGKEFEDLRNNLTTAKITPLLDIDTIKRQLQSLNKDLAGVNLDRVSVAQRELDILNQNPDILDSNLEKRRQNLEVEVKTLEAEKERANIEARFDQGLNALVNRGASNLQILQLELSFLEKIGTKEEELRDKRTEIAIERQNIERTTLDSLLDIQLELLDIQGASELQVIQTRIELEKKLGIEMSGIEAIRQQLELQKAITEENKKTRVERQKDLVEAIKQKRAQNRDQSPFQQSQLDFRRSRLEAEARQVGISQEDIDAIVRPLEGVTADLPTSLDSLATQNGSLEASIFELENSIEVLTQEIIRDVSTSLDTTGVTSLVSPPVQTIVENQTQTQLPSVTSSGAIGEGINRLVQLSIGDTEIYLNSQADAQQIERLVVEQLDIQNEERKRSLMAEIAKQLKTPGTALNSAGKENFNRF